MGAGLLGPPESEQMDSIHHSVRKLQQKYSPRGSNVKHRDEPMPVDQTRRRREELIERILKRQPGASLPQLHGSDEPYDDEEELAPVGSRTVQKPKYADRLVSHQYNSAKPMKGATPGGKAYRLQPLAGRRSSQAAPVVEGANEDGYGSEEATVSEANQFKQYDLRSARPSNSVAGSIHNAHMDTHDRHQGYEGSQKAIQLANHLRRSEPGNPYAPAGGSSVKGRELVLRSPRQRSRSPPVSDYSKSATKSTALVKLGGQ